MHESIFRSLENPFGTQRKKISSDANKAGTLHTIFWTIVSRASKREICKENPTSKLLFDFLSLVSIQCISTHYASLVGQILVGFDFSRVTIGTSPKSMRDPLFRTDEQVGEKL